MNRRSFLGALAAVSAVPALVASAAPVRPKDVEFVFGHLPKQPLVCYAFGYVREGERIYGTAETYYLFEPSNVTRAMDAVREKLRPENREKYRLVSAMQAIDMSAPEPIR